MKDEFVCATRGVAFAPCFAYPFRYPVLRCCAQQQALLAAMRRDAQMRE